MEYTLLDMASYPRKAHFDYFRSLSYPYAGVTVDVDVTDLYRLCKENGRSFYMAFMHVAALAANEVPQFRQRIKDGCIAEYRHCATSHIEPLPDGTYCYCSIEHDGGWKGYFEYAEERRAACRENPSIEDGDADSFLFVTCLPWFKYSALIQPVAGGDESNPRISWGAFKKDADDRLMMPLTILVNHALCDGIHMADFYSTTEQLLASLDPEDFK